MKKTIAIVGAGEASIKTYEAALAAEFSGIVITPEEDHFKRIEAPPVLPPLKENYIDSNVPDINYKKHALTCAKNRKKRKKRRK